eukprot:Tbor_TRINITY_DN3616_c0_g1::TRINITY_DN3616_c0_g1_i1::g.257::m.257/K02519/infB, MTIF2; translation initiation factor IF-2
MMRRCIIGSLLKAYHTSHHAAPQCSLDVAYEQDLGIPFGLSSLSQTTSQQSTVTSILPMLSLREYISPFPSCPPFPHSNNIHCCQHYSYSSYLCSAPTCASQQHQRRHQSQSYHHHQVPFKEGEIQDGMRGGVKNARRLDPENIPHFIKCTIQNDRREMGLTEVDDWKSFAEGAVYLPTRAGALWVGPDDPRCAKLIRRKEKLSEKPGQILRSVPKSDPMKELEKHPLRRYFTTETNLNDPLSTANGLHQAGMIKSTDVKFSASKIEYKPRPPIVTIMGHVDHGKTSLLDYLRRTNVVSEEPGGITQTIGAFKVNINIKRNYKQNNSNEIKNVENKEKTGNDGDQADDFITFIDTPGHAAFKAMREAGAAITDVIILIISAVDGVQPQTEEVIEIAKTNGVPFVVAISKIDRRQDIGHITKRLKELDVELEEEGGDVQLVKISSTEGTGILELLEAVKLQAELGEISTPHPSRCELLIIESKNTPGTNVVSAIVKCGIMKPGLSFVSGLTYGKVKSFEDEHGKMIMRAGPSEPIRFTGFKMLPKPGNVLMQVSGEDHCKNFHLFMKEVYKAEGGREGYLQTLNLESQGQFYNRKPDNNNIRAYNDIPFNIVAKAETFGMLQALLKTIYEIPRLPGIALNVKITEIGGLRDADIAIAGASNQPGCFLIFGKCKDEYFMSIPTYMHVIRFDVLYHGIHELKEKLVGTLPKIKKTRILATATCLQVFKASQSGKGNASGLQVLTGTLNADTRSLQVVRKLKSTSDSEVVETEIVYEGSIKELRRFKEKVPSVEQGLECGLILNDNFVFKVGDIIQDVEHYEEDRDVDAEFEAAVQLEKQMQHQAHLQDSGEFDHKVSLE